VCRQFSILDEKYLWKIFLKEFSAEVNTKNILVLQMASIAKSPCALCLNSRKLPKVRMLFKTLVIKIDTKKLVSSPKILIAEHILI
jgi:hypothetical protein